uniref:Guanylate cyclase domain-containing protein n=1 Tax=Mesocestoides corti TaxID=53468 RepID=A0A5K3EQU4_MESCO
RPKRRQLTLSGWVTGTPVYIEIKLGLRYATHYPPINISEYVLIDKDVILFPSPKNRQDHPQPFALSFEIGIPDGTPLLIYVHLSDCQSTHLQYLLRGGQKQQVHTLAFLQTQIEMPIMLIDTQGLHTPLPFLLLSVFLAILYLMLFVAFLLLCLCKPRRRQLVLPTLLFQSPVPLSSRASSLSSAFTEAAKSSTSGLMAEDSSPYSSPARENSKGIVKSTRRLPTVDGIPMSRKVLIFLYVCFRAFTIFLFTFSVGLSVLLSMESDSFKTLVSCVQNAKGDRIREIASQEAIRKTLSVQRGRRTASPWLQELRQIEKDSDAELSRQTAYFIQQTATCEMQEMRASGEIGLAMADIATLVTARAQNNTSGLRQSTNNPQDFFHYLAIVNATWESVENEFWNPHNVSVQRYMEETRSRLDNQMVQHWSPYTLLLESMLDNPWLATARRAVNATNEALSSPDVGRFNIRSPSTPGYFVGLTPANPREVEALTFAGFLGIPQPANARYAEARMWNNLRQYVHPLRRLRDFEKTMTRETTTGSLQSPITALPTDPFKFYTRTQYFTTEDLDSISRTSSTILRNQMHQRSLLSLTVTTYKHEVILLRDWINIAYLRVFLLVLDAYLIVSRFYSACRNFCALWLGKRRKMYYNSRQKASPPRQRPTLTEHSNAALVLTSSEMDQQNSQQELESLIQPPASTSESDPDLIQTVIQARNNFSPKRIPVGDVVVNQHPNARPNHANSQGGLTGDEICSSNTTATIPLHPNELCNDPDAADYISYNRRGSLPSCCCCLDFHYLLILFGICLIITGLVISTGAGKGLGNNWLLRQSALLSRVEAMDDYRRHMRAMVHYVQLNYLNSQRLLLERNKAVRQLRRLKRIQHWLHHEKEHILRQNLYEVCALTELSGRNHPTFYTLDNTICQRIRQEQQRRQHAPYSTLASRKPPKNTMTLISSLDQLKLPLCAFLPVQSRDAFNSSLNSRERHTILGAEKATSLLSERELRQLHQMFFKNSSFATFLTSLYRLLFTTVLLSMCVCWLLACKHLIVQMVTRNVTVVTSRVTVISPCPPAARRIETFIHTSDSSLSFYRPNRATVVLSRPSIWHSEDDPSVDLRGSHYTSPPDPPPHATNQNTPKPPSLSYKKPRRNLHLKGKQTLSKTQSDSAESRV